MFVVPLLSLLGAALFVGRVLTLRIELVPVQVLSAAVVVLYAAMFAGLLASASFVLVLAGLVALAHETYRARGAWGQLLGRLLTPGIVLFVAFYFLLAVLMRGLETVYWDEFSHWALMPKVLLSLGRYPIEPEVLMFRDYVPGPALVQYLFAKIIGHGEGDIIFAHAVFMLSAFLTLLAPLGWNRPVPLVAAVVACFLLPYDFGEPGTAVWSALLVDYLLPLLFVASLAIYWFGGADTKAILSALPVLGALPLVKEAGTVFAGMAVAIFTVDQALRYARCEAVPRRTWAAIAVAAAVPVLLAKSWGLYLAVNGVRATFDLSPPALSRRLRLPEFGTFADDLVKKFGGALAGSVDIGMSGLALPHWLLALSVLTVFGVIASRHRVRVIAANVILAASFAAYALLLLIHYLFAFGPADALSLPSFGRYLGSFLFGWLLANILFLIAGSATRPRLASGFLAIVAAAAAYYSPPRALAGLHEGPRGSVEQGYLRERREVQAAVAEVKKLVPESKRVYIVWNNTKGFPFYVSRYELAPRPSNTYCFGLGAARYKGDLWSCDYSPELVADLFKKYDFVFLASADRPFWERYGFLFEPGAENSGDRLFRVEREGPGPLLRAVR